MTTTSDAPRPPSTGATPKQWLEYVWNVGILETGARFAKTDLIELARRHNAGDHAKCWHTQRAGSVTEFQVTRMMNTDRTVGLPDLDAAYALTLRANEDVTVDYDPRVSEDGAEIIVRRTVWAKAGRVARCKIVWQEDVMALPRAAAPNFVRDLISQLAG